MTTPSHPQPGSRRGALLLLVLTALTLFMMLGTLMLVTATRARTSARAFADATTSLSPASIQTRAVLDDALMALLRGTVDASGGIGESLLEDKYGRGTLSSSAVRVTGDVNRDAILRVDIVSSATSGTVTTSGSHPSQFAGRILTLLPNPGEGDPASFRIIGSNTAATPTLLVANVPFRSGLRLTSGSQYRARINGREFTPVTGTSTPEAYDGYDNANGWLAQPMLLTGGSLTFPRVSYQASGASPLPQVDNDNDGVLDGVWISATSATGTTQFLQSRPSPLGGTLRYRVSYLVLDLDGRMNINAAGMAVPPPSGMYSGTANTVPLGMGYGPADLDGSLVVSGSPPPNGGPSAFGTPGGNLSATRWGRMLGGGAPIAYSGSPSHRSPRPGIGNAEGRYGPNGVPGLGGDDTRGNQLTSAAAYPLLICGTTSNAVTDLKARRAVYVTGSTGQVTPILRFETPEGSADFVDDPYEARFDVYAKRSATPRTSAPATESDDNPYTLGDLERVLRADDADAMTLPPRLAALLEDRAQPARMTITTDSWDAPALTGSAAATIDVQRRGGGQVQPPQYPWTNTNAWSPDVAAGLKFDLNRVVTGTAQAAEYCRGLYTLALLLGATNDRQTAQWAVNVLDFRDEDSTMTSFAYDTNLTDGWNPNGNDVVYGVERPELLIVETAAWKQQTGTNGQLFVNLFCPEWNAVDTATGRTERRHSSLGDVNALRLTSGSTSIWQVRFDDDRVVQFQPVSNPTPQTQYVLTGTSASVVTRVSNVYGATSGTTTIGSGSNMCLQPASPQNYTVSVPAMTVDQGGAFLRESDGTVWLERLADVTQPNSATNPYVQVDRATVKVVQVPDPPALPPTFVSQVRRGGGGLAAFWRADFDDGDATIATTQSTLNTGAAITSLMPWFHWPNRPYISQAELALVPVDSPVGLLPNYAFPASSLVASGSVGAMLLDATHVPSRFAENTVFMAAGVPWVSESGFDRLGANTFSKWREPGRVNVNTIVSASTPPPPMRDGPVWHTLIGDTNVQLLTGTITANPFVSGTAPSYPAPSMAQLLTLTNTNAGPSEIAIQKTSGVGLDARDKNPAFAYAMVNRLANTATVRSNVFAVWITLEITDDSPSAPSTTYRRLFAIIDRSLPVGFTRGEDLNVRETIRVQRYLE
jgi:hypothetical protein